MVISVYLHNNRLLIPRKIFATKMIDVVLYSDVHR